MTGVVTGVMRTVVFITVRVIVGVIIVGGSRRRGICCV